MEVTNANTHLGKNSEYKDTYDPTLLVREPRANSRSKLGLDLDNLPFVGNDTWNHYEVNALRNNGVPVAAVVKIVYSAASKYIVESKSLKLYFNSMNMEKLGTDTEDVLNEIKNRVSRDLSKLLEVEVRVGAWLASDSWTSDYHTTQDTQYTNWFREGRPGVHYTCLEDYIYDIEVTDYEVNPSLLLTYRSSTKLQEMYACSSLLRSKCLVTKQPDNGFVFIYLKSRRLPDKEALLKYIVSYRNTCHFHEQIVDQMFVDLMNAYEPEELMVRALYARRGGIDINPERATHEYLLHSDLSDHRILHTKTFIQ